MNSKSVILIGGFCEMFELCSRCGLDVIGVVDSSAESVHGYDVPYLGTDDILLSTPARFCKVPLVVVPDSPVVRKRIVERYRANGYDFASVISPEADVSPNCERCEGVVIQSHVVITANARIGAFTKLNIGAKVFHDCQVGDYVTIAPNATLLGRVTVSDSAYVGACSTILPGRRVGRNCVVGAGSVVTHDVPEGLVYAGVPAKRMEHA